MMPWYPELHRIVNDKAHLKWLQRQQGQAWATVWGDCKRPDWMIFYLERYGSPEQRKVLAEHMTRRAQEVWGEEVTRYKKRVVVWPLVAIYAEHAALLSEEDHRLSLRMSKAERMYMCMLYISGYAWRDAEKELCALIRTALPEPPAMLG